MNQIHEYWVLNPNFCPLQKTLQQYTGVHENPLLSRKGFRGFSLFTKEWLSNTEIFNNIS